MPYNATKYAKGNKNEVSLLFPSTDQKNMTKQFIGRPWRLWTKISLVNSEHANVLC